MHRSKRCVGFSCYYIRGTDLKNSIPNPDTSVWQPWREFFRKAKISQLGNLYSGEIKGQGSRRAGTFD